MQSFTARLEKRPGIYAQMLVTLPGGVTLTPRKWSAADMGGPKAATIEATGTPEDLAYLLTWLGDRAIINNEMGSPVWWGVIYEIEATLGGVAVSLSLESVYNRVAVIYPYMLPDGSTESRKTSWVEDSNSINRYGTRELLYSLPEGDETAAEGVRDRLLGQFADPAPVIATRGQNKVGATLHCRGQWSLLDFVYWTNPKGLAAYEEGAGGVQEIGAALKDTTISFGASAAPPADGGTDYIKDSGNRFGPLVEGTVIKVSGAAQGANNGVVTVQHQHGTNIIETVENTQVDEAAGATVTIALGEFGQVGWVAQSFTIPSATGWTATKVALRVQRVGNPGDNLTFKIHANGAGIPGSTIATATITGSTVPTAMNWVEGTLSVPVALNPGTTYWVEVGRTGSTYSLSDYYLVGLDEGLGHSGAMKVYAGDFSGGSWVTRDPDADMPFRITGEADSLTLAKEALAVSDEFLGIVASPATSGVLTRQYRADEVNVLDEVRELLDLGTSDGKRLIARVDHGRIIVIEAVPESNATNPMLGMDGRLRHASGALWEPGKLIVGRWVEIEALPMLDGLTKTKGQRAVYVQECEYDPQNDRLMIQSEGALDPWQAIRWERR